MTTKTIADKIQKIIAKAEGTDNPEEAAVFMAKAGELLDKHNMSMLELGTLADDAVGSEAASRGWNRSSYYATSLYAAGARYYGCEFIYTRRGNKFTGTLIGRQSARTTANLMIDYLAKEVTRAARKLVDEGKEATMSRAKRAVGNALAYRIYTATVSEKRGTQTADGSGVNALVPVDLIKAYMTDEHPDLATRKSGKIKAVGSAARAAADGISLSRQMDGAGEKHLSIAAQ